MGFFDAISGALKSAFGKVPEVAAPAYPHFEIPSTFTSKIKNPISLLGKTEIPSALQPEISKLNSAEYLDKLLNEMHRPQEAMSAMANMMPKESALEWAKESALLVEDRLSAIDKDALQLAREYLSSPTPDLQKEASALAAKALGESPTPGAWLVQGIAWNGPLDISELPMPDVDSAFSELSVNIIELPKGISGDIPTMPEFPEFTSPQLLEMYEQMLKMDKLSALSSENSDAISAALNAERQFQQIKLSMAEFFPEIGVGNIPKSDILNTQALSMFEMPKTFLPEISLPDAKLTLSDLPNASTQDFLVPLAVLGSIGLSIAMKDPSFTPDFGNGGVSSAGNFIGDKTINIFDPQLSDLPTPEVVSQMKSFIDKGLTLMSSV